MYQIDMLSMKINKETPLEEMTQILGTIHILRKHIFPYFSTHSPTLKQINEEMSLIT